MNKNIAVTILLLCIFILGQVILHAQGSILVAINGEVIFTSEAPLELIKARSDKLKGAIDRLKKTFAFAVEVHSFNGFHDDLQREHFFENYMETDKYPTASFSGKFIEQVDLNTNGIYYVRAKGMFNLHGVQKEKIIAGTILVNNDYFEINTTTSIRLEDHDIKVPKIVYEKIAEVIKVEISIRFKK